jgi:hypothetical protein
LAQATSLTAFSRRSALKRGISITRDEPDDRHKIEIIRRFSRLIIWFSFDLYGDYSILSIPLRWPHQICFATDGSIKPRADIGAFAQQPRQEEISPHYQWAGTARMG